MCKKPTQSISAYACNLESIVLSENHSYDAITISKVKISKNRISPLSKEFDG
jgi:hypothetical protein